MSCPIEARCNIATGPSTARHPCHFYRLVPKSSILRVADKPDGHPHAKAGAARSSTLKPYIYEGRFSPDLRSHVLANAKEFQNTIGTVSRLSAASLFDAI